MSYNDVILIFHYDKSTLLRTPLFGCLHLTVINGFELKKWIRTFLSAGVEWRTLFVKSRWTSHVSSIKICIKCWCVCVRKRVRECVHYGCASVNSYWTGIWCASQCFDRNDMVTVQGSSEKQSRDIWCQFYQYVMCSFVAPKGIKFVL